jgi:hypothetical protein
LNNIFAHARTALWYGLQQLPMKRGQTMLVPDYICEVVLHPLQDLGIRVVFYPVNDNFAPDWEIIEKIQINKPAQAFLLVHYFGQPQDIERAKAFCNQNGLLLIEDNSHGYGGTLNGQLLGSFGDLGISSPRKQLRSPSGGILFLRGKPINQITERLSDYQISRGKDFLRFLVRPFPRIKAGLIQLLRPEPDFSDPSAFPEIRMEYQMADRNSERRILSENWLNHAKSRREAWKAWSNFSLENGLQPVWEIPHPESCPWVMPVYVSSQEERLYWIRWSRKNGIDFFPWPSLPESLLQSSSTVVDRWLRLFCFPLEQISKKIITHKKPYVT